MVIKKIIEILTTETKYFTPTLIKQIIKDHGKNPFLILICCLLSLRSKDTVTINVCNDLLKIAKTPKEILNIKLQQLEKIIFKTGFYRNKAKVLHQVSKIIIEKHNGLVPKTEDKLLKLPGVGRKTTNLVLGMAFDKPAICVDIHVHRISNRLGLITRYLIKTNTPEKTEIALKKLLQKKDWIKWNDLIVKFGQNICTPISPWCSKCVIKKYCKQIGVKKIR